MFSTYIWISNTCVYNVHYKLYHTGPAQASKFVSSNGKSKCFKWIRHESIYINILLTFRAIHLFAFHLFSFNKYIILKSIFQLKYQNEDTRKSIRKNLNEKKNYKSYIISILFVHFAKCASENIFELCTFQIVFLIFNLKLPSHTFLFHLFGNKCNHVAPLPHIQTLLNIQMKLN